MCRAIFAISCGNADRWNETDEFEELDQTTGPHVWQMRTSAPRDCCGVEGEMAGCDELPREADTRPLYMPRRGAGSGEAGVLSTATILNSEHGIGGFGSDGPLGRREMLSMGDGGGKMPSTGVADYRISRDARAALLRQQLSHGGARGGEHSGIEMQAMALFTPVTARSTALGVPATVSSASRPGAVSLFPVGRSAGGDRVCVSLHAPSGA